MPEAKRALSESEQAQCAGFLARATPVPRMELPILRAIWNRRLFPMNPVECVVLDNLDEPARVFLTRRPANDPDHRGRPWHHPGSYLGGNEKFSDAVNRVCETEVGCGVSRRLFVAPANLWNLARDHEASFVFACELKGVCGESEARQWFPLGKLPEDLLPHHRLIQFRAVRFLNFRHALFPGIRAEFDWIMSPEESGTEA